MSNIPTGSTGEACPVCREDYDNCDCPEVTGLAPAQQMPLSPCRKVLWPWFVIGALNAVAFAGYGHWRDQRGFERGADSAICAMAITLDGNSAIGRFEACRNIKDHSWYINGFSRRDKGKGA